MARPSTLDESVLHQILERLSNGEPLAQICRDEGMPHRNTVRNWSESEPDISVRIARAREDGEDRLAAECLEIADDSTNDYIETKHGPQLNAEHVQRSKLRIETRLKLLAKWNPKKYGDRLELAGKVEIPQTVLRSVLDEPSKP